jgi:hypothetical protein
VKDDDGDNANDEDGDDDNDNGIVDSDDECTCIISRICFAQSFVECEAVRSIGHDDGDINSASDCLFTAPWNCRLASRRHPLTVLCTAFSIGTNLLKVSS